MTLNSNLEREMADAAPVWSIARRPMLAVSLKMYMGLQETYDWTRAVVEAARQRNAASRVDIVIFPSYPALERCRQLTIGSGIELGAQNIFWEDRGPYTGEVSGQALRELGCACVEVGHAERRRLFLETNRTTAAKALAGHRNKLLPIVCVGETTRREAKHAAEECLVQAHSVLEVVPNGAPIVFAYEPAWAIGADRPADAGYVNSVLRMIRSELPDAAKNHRFLYGGSAGPGLYRDLAGCADGLFLGRFAHDPRAFAAVLDEMLSAAAEADTNATGSGGYRCSMQ